VRLATPDPALPLFILDAAEEGTRSNVGLQYLMFFLAEVKPGGPVRVRAASELDPTPGFWVPDEFDRTRVVPAGTPSPGALCDAVAGKDRADHPGESAAPRRGAAGGGQGVRERHGDPEKLLDGEPALGDELIERLALDEPHREEVDAVRLLDGVDADDSRVVEGGERLRLALEALGSATSTFAGRGAYGCARRASLSMRPRR